MEMPISCSFTDSNLNHTGIYLYSKGKIMIHLSAAGRNLAAANTVHQGEGTVVGDSVKASAADRIGHGDSFSAPSAAQASFER